MDRRVSGFLDAVAAWAAARDDVRAVLLIGSQARIDTFGGPIFRRRPGLFVDVPKRYLRDVSWIRSFGEPLLTFLEPTAIGGFEERRVLFRDGLEVDFSILPAAVAKKPPPEAAAVLAGGFRHLRRHRTRRAEPAGSTPSSTRAQAQLDQLSNDFWYHLRWGPKKLRRGELLLAKQVCDCYLTERIVELVRWRERWAGEQTLEALMPTFAKHDAADIGRSLRAKGEFFGGLEHDVVERFGLVQPVDRSEILRRLDGLLADDLA